MDQVHVTVLLTSVFLLLSVLTSKLSARLGMPALILFIVIGMIAGSDGLGKIEFEDFLLTKTLGMTLLGFILFAGGFETHWKELRPVVAKGLALSTVGVLISCTAVGAFAHYVFKLGVIESFLLGGILASTDAAAIFGSLKSGGIKLKNGLGPLLEIESGTNDPVAVFLTVSLAKLATDPQTSLVSFLPALLLQMPIGILIGIGVAKFTVWLINSIRLEFEGLYTVITLACAAFTLGCAPLLGGNEFIAVYAAGVTLGSSRFIHKMSLLKFHDGLAWLLQIIVFLALGLLVFPSHLVPMVGAGLAFAFFLVFVARPISVFVALTFSSVEWRGKLFVSWAGLKGAFPIILATYPVLSGLKSGEFIFNLVFFAVFVSVAIQGTLLRWVGKGLKVVEEKGVSDDEYMVQSEKLLKIEVLPESFASGKRVFELGLPSTALIVMVRRDDGSFTPSGSTVIMPDDELLIASRRSDLDELKLMIHGKQKPI